MYWRKSINFKCVYQEKNKKNHVLVFAEISYIKSHCFLQMNSEGETEGQLNHNL